MTTEIETLTSDWVDLTTALGLQDTVTYIAQNIGSNALYLVESLSTPPADARGHVISSTKGWLVKQDGTNKFFARVAVGDETEIAFTESE